MTPLNDIIAIDIHTHATVSTRRPPPTTESAR